VNPIQDTETPADWQKPTDVVLRGGASGASEVQVQSALTVTPEQLDIVRKTIAPPDATPAELELYLYDCKRQGVHPLDRLLHFTKRGGKYTPITSIDLMRARAADTGELAGSDDAVFKESQDGSPCPLAASVTVFRLVSGIRCPFTATARWNEYYPGDGKEGFMWRKMHHVMLAKCAEALALRKAFPRQLAGVYSREEMDQAGAPTPASHPETKVSYVEEVPHGTMPEQRASSDPIQEVVVEPEKPLAQEVNPAPVPAPATPKRTHKEEQGAIALLLNNSKTKFISQVTPVMEYALRYFRGLDKFALLPNETLLEISPLNLFPGAVWAKDYEETIAAIKADRDRHMSGIKEVMDADQLPGLSITKADVVAAVAKPAKPIPPGTITKRIQVKAVAEKAGQSAKGPWLRFGVCSAEEQWFNTFDRTLGEKAKALKGQYATIWFLEGQKGNDLVGIEAQPPSD
jgi:phage recombination protein Bet